MIVTNKEFEEYKTENTRPVPMPDGSTKDVRMTPDLWADLEFLKVVEHITTEELVQFALEEVELQSVTFDRAFRGVVAHLANRWT